MEAGLVATAFVLGLRHGVDWDHIAAIADIASSQVQPRLAFLLASLYAAGHALVVFVLGALAISLGDLLPASLDAAMERVVGITLIALGVYVFYALIRDGRSFRMKSRWMLVFSLVRRTAARLRPSRAAGPHEVEHAHSHPVDRPHDHEHLEPFGPPGPATRMHRHAHRHVSSIAEDPFMTYGTRTSFLVGMIHGVGAETPTQLLVFLAAAGATGARAGAAVLVAFCIGLVASNTLVALASTYGFLRAERSFPVYAGIAVATGALSLAVGALFLLGHASHLPVMFG